MKPRLDLPHPAVFLDDCPQLRSVIEEMAAGTYPLPDVAVWRPDLEQGLRIRLARATGATAEQVAEQILTDREERRAAKPPGRAESPRCATCGRAAHWPGSPGPHGHPYLAPDAS